VAAVDLGKLGTLLVALTTMVVTVVLVEDVTVMAVVMESE
jgi:hypothetical protein